MTDAVKYFRFLPVCEGIVRQLSVGLHLAHSRSKDEASSVWWKELLKVIVELKIMAEAIKREFES